MDSMERGTIQAVGAGGGGWLTFHAITSPILIAIQQTAGGRRQTVTMTPPRGLAHNPKHFSHFASLVLSILVRTLSLSLSLLTLQAAPPMDLGPFWVCGRKTLAPNKEENALAAMVMAVAGAEVQEACKTRGASRKRLTKQKIKTNRCTRWLPCPRRMLKNSQRREWKYAFTAFRSSFLLLISFF